MLECNQKTQMGSGATGILGMVIAIGRTGPLLRPSPLVPSSFVVEFPWQLYGVIAYQVVTVDLLCLEFFLQHETHTPSLHLVSNLTKCTSHPATQTGFVEKGVFV
jgi:hypothetical protein